MSSVDASEPTAVLVDFGGVLTASLLGAFAQFGASLGADPGLPMRLLGEDPISRQLISDHECGRIDADAFARGFADRLSAHGPQVSADGLLTRMQAGLTRDEGMVALVAQLRAAGHPLAVVTNAFGRDTYAGYELDKMADLVVISSEVGVRKPSRRIYSLACEGLGVRPEQAVMIDDLQHNLDGAARLGIAGILHTSAADTQRQLADRFGVVVRPEPA